MCKNAQVTVEDVLGGIISTATVLGTEFNLTTNVGFVSALAGLKQAQADVANWKPGTAAENVIQMLTDASGALQLLSGILPANAVVLLQTILAGIVGVIGTLDGNGAVPAGTTATAHASDVAAHTVVQVKTLAPN